MSATVRVGRWEATVSAGVWTCDAPAIAEILQRIEWQPVALSYVPDQDAAWASYVARVLGGEVIRLDLPSLPEGVVF